MGEGGKGKRGKGGRKEPIQVILEGRCEDGMGSDT